jgi:hypothetical protein
MLEGLEVASVSRMGRYYSLHFADGSHALFDPEDFEPILCEVGLMLLKEMDEQNFSVN